MIPREEPLSINIARCAAGVPCRQGWIVWDAWHKGGHRSSMPWTRRGSIIDRATCSFCNDLVLGWVDICQVSCTQCPGTRNILRLEGKVSMLDELHGFIEEERQD